MGRHKEDIIKDRCWQCGKKMATEFKGRCHTCQTERCLHCGSPLIKIKRITEDDLLVAESEVVCSNSGCFRYIDLKNLKQVWKIIK
jgi:hypothetical protein